MPAVKCSAEVPYSAVLTALQYIALQYCSAMLGITYPVQSSEVRSSLPVTCPGITWSPPAATNLFPTPGETILLAGYSAVQWMVDSVHRILPAGYSALDGGQSTECCQEAAVDSAQYQVYCQHAVDSVEV